MTRRALLAAVALQALSCRQDMHDQPRLKPYARSDFFADERASRQPVPGTIGLFITLIFLFVRFLPAISIFEMRTILPGAAIEEEKA